MNNRLPPARRALALLFVSVRRFALRPDHPSRRPRPKMLLVINFDVEDYTTPASEGIDDIPKWLAEIMSEEGVTGTFYVIGEKARSLEQRGRRRRHRRHGPARHREPHQFRLHPSDRR